LAKVMGTNSQELNSAYSFGNTDGKKVGKGGGKAGLILESWGPSTRNSDYYRAFEIILSRLQACQVTYVNAWVVSRDLLKVFPKADQRAVKINGSERLVLPGADIDKLRKAIGRAVAALKKSPHTKGGNEYKRLLLYHPLLTRQMWDEIASGKITAGFFADLITTPTSNDEALDEKVATLLSAGENIPHPEGVKQPKRAKKEIEEIERDPKVKAWVLEQAQGVCEVCDKTAPFKKSDGMPYLEVHHLRPLATGGTDTTANTIAVCPNCHMELHYSHGRELLRKSVLEKIERLHDEGGLS